MLELCLSPLSLRVLHTDAGTTDVCYIRRCLAQLALDPIDDIYFVVAFLDETAFAQKYPRYRLQPHMLGVLLVSYCSAGNGGASALSRTPPPPPPLPLTSCRDWACLYQNMQPKT